MTKRRSNVTEAYERCTMARDALVQLDGRCMEATEDRAGILWERWLLPNGVSVVLFATPHWWEVFRPACWQPSVEQTLRTLREIAGLDLPTLRKVETIGEMARAGEIPYAVGDKP